MGNEVNTEASATPIRERFSRTLKERAAYIKSVRMDVYTTKPYQLALYFFFGIVALGLLVASMLIKNNATLSLAFMISGVVAAVLIVFYYMAIRALAPMSFLQYTALDNGKRYCFRIMSKHRSVFSDGENIVEVDKLVFKQPEALELDYIKFDFFADMDADLRIVKGEKEIYKGTLDIGHKTVKCKITFVNNVPFVAVINGMRLKYFDINSTKEHFVVPAELKQAAQSYGVAFPKLQGLRVRDERDATRQ